MALLSKFIRDHFSLLSNGAFFVIAVLHLIGIIGLNIPSCQLGFERCSGINLLLSFFLVLFFQVPFNINFLLFCFLTFFIGLAAEILGVNTGYPFGSYSYSGILGPMVLGVPLIIGLNWLLLSYCAAITARIFLAKKWQVILAASIMMLGIDLLLEPFAVRHHFWAWQNNTPPVQNYVSWLLISVFIQFTFSRLIPASYNLNALRYLIILLVFLFTDLIILHL